MESRLKMQDYTIKLTDEDINTLLQLITFAQLEIMRQMKKLSKYDFDIKEYYWHNRYYSNQLRDELKNLRGY